MNKAVIQFSKVVPLHKPCLGTNYIYLHVANFLWCMSAENDNNWVKFFGPQCTYMVTKL